MPAPKGNKFSRVGGQPSHWKKPMLTGYEKRLVQRRYGNILLGALEKLEHFMCNPHWELEGITEQHVEAAWKIVNKYFPSATPETILEMGSQTNILSLTQVVQQLPQNSSPSSIPSPTSEPSVNRLETSGNTPRSMNSLSEIAGLLRSETASPESSKDETSP
jgi:hypothetical protein